MLLIYIWGDSTFFSAYQVPDRERASVSLVSVIDFLWTPVFTATAIVAVAWALKAAFTPNANFPDIWPIYWRLPW